MIDIAVMTGGDIGFAVSLTAYEGWGNVAADFERLIYFEPQGCFVARVNGRKAGMITTTSSGSYAFMGSLIVAQEYRRRGIGEALMRHAMSSLYNRGVACLELDATFQGVPLYRQLGFKDKYLSLRLAREADTQPRAQSPMSRFSWEEILTFDRIKTGLDRGAILSRFFDEFEYSAYTSGEEKIKGFALVYPRADNFKAIGPIIADSEEIAQQLIDEIIRHNSGYNLGIGVPETARNLTPFLRDHQFEYRAPSLRMYHGEKREYESAMYAIISPEKG